MEISINIKLEDADIGLLIKSLFELIKKLPKDNLDIHINPVSVPPITVPSTPAPIGDPLCGCVVGDSNIPCGCVVGESPNCPCQCVVGSDSIDGSAYPVDTGTTTDYETLKEAICGVENDIYYSNNGESVKKLESEKKLDIEKKNEEN